MDNPTVDAVIPEHNARQRDGSHASGLRAAGDVKDVSRRDIATVLLGAIGVAALTGCGAPDGAPEPIARTPRPDGVLGKSAAAYSGGTALWVDTLVGDLYNLVGEDGTGATVIGMAVVGGYSAIGDGGGGVFYWDPTTTAGDNGGTIVVPTTSVHGRWVRIYSGAVNVRWFGAGLGSPDDQPAIQRAITVAQNIAGVLLGGGTVYLPAGHYRIQSPIELGFDGSNCSIRLVGDGKFATHVEKDGANATCVQFGNASFGGHGVLDCEISNIHFQPSTLGTQSSGSVIRFPYGGVTGVLIEHVHMTDVLVGLACVPASGIVSNVRLNDVTMDRVGHYGIYAYSSEDWWVTDSTFNLADVTAGTFGVWLDTDTKGWRFRGVLTTFGEAGWRFTNILGHSAPTDHQFDACEARDGGTACFWVSFLGSSTFRGCRASTPTTRSASFISAFIADGQVWGLTWDAGVIAGVYTSAFLLTGTGNFAITNSTFTDWGAKQANTYSAINLAGASTSQLATMVFTITGNTFFAGIYGPTYCWRGINVTSTWFYRYVIALNTSYDCYGPLAGHGPLGNTILTDSGGAFAKYVPAGSNL